LRLDSISEDLNPQRSLASPLATEEPFLNLPDVDLNNQSASGLGRQQFKNIFYHATAFPNYSNIKKVGLSISERGVNKYKTDELESLADIYGGKAEAKKYQKPPCIHLSNPSELGINFGKDINFIHKIAAIVLEIHLSDEESKTTLQSDVEEGSSKKAVSSFIYCADIPPEKIKPIHIVSYNEKMARFSICPYNEQLITSLFKLEKTKFTKKNAGLESDLPSADSDSESDNEVEIPAVYKRKAQR
jgi:hypothetical protein